MVKINELAPYKAARNVFNLGHQFDFTCKMGYAIPVLVQNYVPGDSFKIDIDHLARLLPLQTPTMTNITARFDCFRVDNHITAPKFLDFIKQSGNEKIPIEWANKVVPAGGFEVGSLGDYLGFATKTGAGDNVDVLPFRAYYKIWNDWYRNSQLQDELEFSTDMGVDNTDYKLQKINWKKDRFTSLLPSTQRGDDIVLPIGNKANIYAPTIDLNADNGSISGILRNTYNITGNAVSIGPDGSLLSAVNHKDGDLIYGAYTDLSNATGVSLPALSIAMQLQRYNTLAMMGGDRYSEWQKIMYGVDSSDARLQRSEWLGSWKHQFITSEVLQTSETSNQSPQGSMAGHGFSCGQKGFYTGTLNEFGYIMVIMHIMPNTLYQQGLPAKYNKSNPFDYLIPIFSRLPLQGVKNSEIYWQDASVKNGEKQVNDETLGYAPIYDDYRYNVSRVSGKFRTSLNFWLMTRIFDRLPKLNNDLIVADPTDRIFAVNQATEDPVLCHINFRIKALRKLPKVGVPVF